MAKPVMREITREEFIKDMTPQQVKEMDDMVEADIKGLPVKGYAATQPQWKLDAVNRVKVLEEKLYREIEAQPGDTNPRLAAIAKTQIELGCAMACKAIFNNVSRLTDEEIA